MASNTKSTASKSSAKAAETPAAAPTMSFVVEDAPDAAEALKTTRTSKPNPLLDALRSSLEQKKVLQVPVTSFEQATEVENLLRRASKTLGCGLSMRNDGSRIVFQGKAEKRERKYTAAQIREWAKKEGASDEILYPRISKDVRLAFRKAHGLTKDDAVSAEK